MSDNEPLNLELPFALGAELEAVLNVIEVVKMLHYPATDDSGRCSCGGGCVILEALQSMDALQDATGAAVTKHDEIKTTAATQNIAVEAEIDAMQSFVEKTLGMPVQFVEGD